MDFAAAEDAVRTLVRRTDPVFTTFLRLQINAACRMINAAGRFAQDLVEWQYTGADITLSAEPGRCQVTLPTNCRVIDYVQWPDSQIEGQTQVHLVTPSYVLANLAECRYLAYQSGTLLRLVLSADPTTIVVGYYRRLPELVNPTDTNWLLEQVPELVINYAATWALAFIGEKEIAQRAEAMSAIGVQVHVQDMIRAMGSA